jgi:hypothetical protein
MPILKFKQLTREQYNALSIYDNNTRYTVIEVDQSIKEYMGTTPYTSTTGSGGGDGGVTLYSDVDLSDNQKIDTGNIKITGFVMGKIDADQW